MLFNSYIFILLFLPVVLIGLRTPIGSSRRTALVWLVCASLVYYGWWQPRYLLLIGLSIVVNYRLGQKIEQSSGRKRRVTLLAGVAANLLALGWFKYANFFVDTTNAIVGSSVQLAPVLLPLAISFFTFQQIAYLVDTARDKVHEHSFLDYCLFVCFFPQLIAGPIVHHAEMMPQFTSKRWGRRKGRQLAIGTTIFTMGLAKKVLLADTAAGWSTPIFELAAQGSAPTFAEAWVATIAYSFQIYFDFSGYSDMAVGLACCFGIRLPLNFNSPYKATSIIDFWRRWHITLSRFLRDYLYIPLGGNRCGSTRRYVNLMIAMLLGGLWHGAGLTFVFWGALHGLYLMVNHAWRALTGECAFVKTRTWRVAATAITFLSVCIAWVYFRAGTFDVANSFLYSMFGGHGAGISLRLNSDNLGLLILVMGVIVWLMPNSVQLMARVRPVIDQPETWNVRKWWRWRPTLLWAVLVAILLIVTLIHIGGSTSEFIYYQF